jgi:hypothetical protein
MKMVDSMQTAKNRAAEALRAVLHQVSQIKVRNIDIDTPRPDLKVDFLAHLDVLGHSHTLVCKVEANGRPEHVRMVLSQWRHGRNEIRGNATLVFIAPRVSEEAQLLCRESQAGFLDLEGNARIDLGEVFIGKRSWPQKPVRCEPASVATPDEELVEVA